MGQTGGFGSSASGRFWLCPQCNRHVPTRQDTCRCGGTRPEEAAASAASTAAAPQLTSHVAAVSYAAGHHVASASPAELVYPNERPLFAIGLVISIGFWLLLLV